VEGEGFEAGGFGNVGEVAGDHFGCYEGEERSAEGEKEEEV
jgi:hypothetical protein